MSDTMHVTIATLSDNQAFDIDAPPDVTAGDLVRTLIDEGHIPPPPAQHNYRLAVKGGAELDESAGLAHGGVTEGATLRLYTTTPGASSEDGAFRRDRLRGDLREMQNIRCRHISWTPIGGGSSGGYEVTYHLRSYVGPDQMRARHVVLFHQPDRYPGKPNAWVAPIVMVASKPTVFHPNFFQDGRVCIGNSWNAQEGLGSLALRVARMILFHPDLTDPRKGKFACEAAASWYLANRARFPLGRDIVFPDPLTGELQGARSRIVIRRVVTGAAR